MSATPSHSTALWVNALDAYRSDFRQRDAAVTDRDSWKFERRQDFQEQASPSWDAFRRGEWAEALRLMGDRREHWRRLAREDRERRSAFHRVRVVEEPLTPYLQWELHALRVQGESGMPVRVVDGAGLRHLEATAAPLPEVVVRSFSAGRFSTKSSTPVRDCWTARSVLPIPRSSGAGRRSSSGSTTAVRTSSPTSTGA